MRLREKGPLQTLTVAALCLIFLAIAQAQSPSLSLAQPLELPGLKAQAQIIRDTNGIAHIQAKNEHDLHLLLGYIHAQDRLFQMDLRRRQASGTLAEILGPAVLSSDVQLRTIGLRRAAIRSLLALSKRAQADLQAYSEGVNAFVAANPQLPPEYQALELSKFEPWTPLDSVEVAKLIAFGLSFDLDDIDRTITLLSYQGAGGVIGFDGTKLFFEDLFRSAPFDPASTIPDVSSPSTAFSATSRSIIGEGVGSKAARIQPRALELGKEYLERVRNLPLFYPVLRRDRSGGSNEWAIRGAFSASGVPLLANDPHLALDAPSIFYPVHLQAGQTNVIGGSFAGALSVIVGHNRYISWGATINPMDVTDVFQEQVMPDPTSPSGLSIVHSGQLEPIIPIPEVFRQNNPGNGVFDDITVVPPGTVLPSGDTVPPATLIVPRRNNGPIIELDLTAGIALSVQYTGFSPTREVDAFLILDEAKGLNDFVRGLQFFDFGSENLVYSDTSGNIAYFTSGEMPVREDLQAGTVNGLPPFFIRDGTGGNDWSPVQHPQPNQAVPYEILPFAEMPHIINPPTGWFVNSNNDPAGITLDNDPLNQFRPGGGIYYLNPGYDGGFRAGRVTRLIRQKLSSGSGKISFADMQEMQADTVLPDAEVFVPYILQAFDRARATGADPLLAVVASDPAVIAAVGRLRNWDFTTPTGIPEGYDASDFNGNLFPPSNAEIASSVAATIYSVWRSEFIRNTIDATLLPFGLPLPDSQRTLSALRNLLDHFSINNGFGASGLNFFNVPAVSSAADRRDIIILESIAGALTRLAGDQFAAAFGNSTDQNDYRWGKLHRLVLEHPLDGPFSIPPAGGAFPPPLSGLAGIPVDGGFETVDAASHPVRADGVDAFMFGVGPSQRFVSEGTPSRMHAVSSLPGGTSGVLGSPYYVNLLPAWLTNEAFSLLFKSSDVQQNAASVTEFKPAK